ncbi:MAG: TlyA family RNA methyltransferase [Syntrophales bacterium]|jgi:23S rRNA (cytidine1920-2'-O)/16S rRNA (cytidine1409-2'-O)-methyltransferase|nr:TlyA family RNA methyltransferase [Syntrophales bacterium]
MKKSPKIRLDSLLLQRELACDLKHAQALILSGAVLANDQVADKAGGLFPADVNIRLRGDANLYVSRGGIKLNGALQAFGFSVQGLVALDVGASTGGFTDCLLQAGAKKVYAVDVGYGQLAWKLRSDPRVVNIERTNIRNYDSSAIGDDISLAVIDASFISLRTVIPSVLGMIKNGAFLICLVKPQFEVARGEVGEKGVVRDPLLHERTLAELEAFCRGIGLEVLGRCDSPITGPAGNREFFLYLKKGFQLTVDGFRLKKP